MVGGRRHASSLVRTEGLVKIVTYDYHVTMSEKPIRVAELKARLSEYLRRVRKGDDLTVYDRDQPIARIVPYAAPAGRLVVREPLRSYRTLGHIPLPPPLQLPV